MRKHKAPPPPKNNLGNWKCAQRTIVLPRELLDMLNCCNWNGLTYGLGYSFSSKTLPAHQINFRKLLMGLCAHVPEGGLTGQQVSTTMLRPKDVLICTKRVLHCLITYDCTIV